ncbi:class I SAM-dependent methyltransferase [Candidatus Micrarchaeota archaeon]|nr:class I SAM-dependent methyltransferase [Candidatus Micrarchaeota archaeon]
MKILELGCGNKKGCGCPYKGDIVGVDISPDSKADIIWNLEKFPYPFKNNEFDAVYIHHCLEHLEDTVKVMDQIWKITKPHGKVLILVPYGASAWSLTNPTHKKFFNYATLTDFKGFKVLKCKYNYVHRGFPELQSWKGRLLRQLTKPMDWLINANPYIYDKILRHYLGDADEIEWELEVIK